MNRFLDLCVPGVRALEPYEPGKPIGELQRELGLDDVVKLASNENPLGPSPKALEAMRGATGGVSLYPDGNGFELKRRLGEHLGLDPGRVTLGSGSDHIIDLVARAFLCPGRSAVMSRHGFAIYAIVTRASGAELRVADALPADHPSMPYGHDLEAVAGAIAPDTRVVFLANPNNPTGTWFDRHALDSLLEAAGRDVLVVVDEAYHEYVDEPGYPDSRALLDTHDNLVVLRTFSKAYGLAGLRVGYAMASPGVTDLVNRVRLPFNPNSLAQAAATAALDDAGHLEATVSLNREERERLDAGLRALGLRTLPSVCNFVTVDVGRPGREMFEALLERGVIVRPLDAYDLPRHVRISVGLPPENARVLAALGEALAG